VGRIARVTGKPTVGGFTSSGVNTSVEQYDWDYTEFLGSPCAKPDGWPNVQAACDPSLDFDPVDPGSKSVEGWSQNGPFFSFPSYRNIECFGDDIVSEEEVGLVRQDLVFRQSARLAREFSLGELSGSPSLKSVGVPISNTAYSVVDTVGHLVEARSSNESYGPYNIHVPSFLRPLFEKEKIVSNEMYRVIYDSYSARYVPAMNIPGGSAATIPDSKQAWVAISGGYEWGASEPMVGVAQTIEDRRANKKFIQGEHHLFYRFETCNVFLAKVTAFQA